MIRINLLPEEFIEKKNTLPIPFKEISLILTVLTALLWALFFYQSRNLGRELTGLQTELNALSPEMTRAEQLLQEMNLELLPKKKFMDKITAPELEWDRVMDSLSRAIPRGVWLTALTFSEFPDLVIRLEGLAKPYENRSSVSLVGDFVTQTQKEFEALAAQKGSSQKVASSIFRAETFTQQKDSEDGKVTEFIVEFRKKS